MDEGRNDAVKPGRMKIFPSVKSPCEQLQVLTVNLMKKSAIFNILFSMV
jgi:hypothetical protein